MTTEKRQRIEGALHRSLPATLTIRAADDGQAWPSWQFGY